MEQDTLWKQFYKLLGSEVELKTLQQVVIYLLQLIEDPATSAKSIAKFISSDPALSTKVLTVVNSPAIGLRHRITDLSLAISLLGLEQIRDIVLNIAIIQKARQEQQAIQIWKHSFYCGKTAETIAKNLGRMSGEAFTTGLLHDIGKIILCYTNPMAFSTALNNFQYQRGAILHWESERKTIGMDHAAIGGLACIYWKLPDTIAKVIWNHHSPSPLPPKTEEEYLSQVVYAADTFTWLFGYPSIKTTINPYNGKDAAIVLSENLRDSMGLTDEKLRNILIQTKTALKQSENIFEMIGASREFRR